jgi:hypothetical protein
MLAFFLLAKYQQKAMDKNGLQNSLKEFFKNKNKMPILVMTFFILHIKFF